jgi:hypothetical protein
MILFAHQIPLDFVYSAVRNSMRFGEKTDLRLQLVDQQMPVLCFCSAFCLHSSSKSAHWCMQTSAVQHWPCLFAGGSSKLLGEVLSPENTPVRILLYGFRRRVQLHSRPTHQCICSKHASPTNSAGRRERVLLHQRYKTHTREPQVRSLRLQTTC